MARKHLNSKMSKTYSQPMPKWTYDKIPSPPMGDVLSLLVNFLEVIGYQQSSATIVSEANINNIRLDPDAVQQLGADGLFDVFATYYKKTKSWPSFRVSQEDSKIAGKGIENGLGTSEESKRKLSSNKRVADDGESSVGRNSKRRRHTKSASSREESLLSSSDASDDTLQSSSTDSDSSASSVQPDPRRKDGTFVEHYNSDSSSSSTTTDSDSTAVDVAASTSDSVSSSSESDSSRSGISSHSGEGLSKNRSSRGKPRRNDVVEVDPLPARLSSKAARQSREDTEQKLNIKPELKSKPEINHPCIRDATIHPDRLARLPVPVSILASPALEVSATDPRRVKTGSVPFSRIPTNIVIDPRFASNAYVSYDYADKAHQDLIVTKGKGFTKEKNKKKRGSYRGGTIDLTPKGIKFDD